MDEFGELVGHLKPGAKKSDEFCARWERGIRLIMCEESGEIIVYTECGVVRVCEIRRMNLSEESWQDVGARKYVDAAKARVRVPIESGPPQSAELSEPQEMIRRYARIDREAIVRFGFTLKCPGCGAIRRGVKTVNQSELLQDQD